MLFRKLLFMSPKDNKNELTSEESLREAIKIENRYKNGANWFNVIAIFSIINIILIKFAADVRFLLGLGITHIIDSIIILCFKNNGIIIILGLLINIIISISFVLISHFSKKSLSVYLIGIILYCADGFLTLLNKDLWSVLFHIFSIYILYQGYKAGKEFKKTSEK